ncbi:MAG: hypothetical protein H6819_06235 [Phycisphaerales bacterium]|nr:hypothetical protein [Phycisphaerales bacterium]MCB9858581.1 hypothetical protein [Phycisphaerales bacterium]
MEHPRSFVIQALTAAFATALLIAGCAPAQFADGLSQSIQRNDVSDARSRIVRGMPFLRVDDYLLDRLESAAQADGETTAEQLNDVLIECHALAISSAGIEIEHLPASAIDALWKSYFADNASSDDRRDAVRDRYLQQLDDEFAALQQRVALAGSTDEVRSIARSITQNVGPSIKDQHGGGPLLQAIASKYERTDPTVDSLSGAFDVYAIQDADPLTPPASGTSNVTPDALAVHAPILVQERSPNATYPAKDDQPGAVSLSGPLKNLSVHIDPARPTIYAYSRKAVINGREHLQLVYCWWFSEHPAMSPGDPEAGNIDGATVRITLDSNNQPAIVETIQNCGCHIRCFARADLEEQARGEFTEIGDETNYALEKPKNQQPRLEVSQLFEAPEKGRPWRLVLICRAGFHDVVAVKVDQAALLSGKKVLERRTYDLLPYDVLENLPTSFGTASMFGPDGLVHNAGRLEGWLLAPTGMRSAGQPRQRGTQLICWDALNFDDPHLLEKALRLPTRF